MAYESLKRETSEMIVMLRYRSERMENHRRANWTHYNTGTTQMYSTCYWIRLLLYLYVTSRPSCSCLGAPDCARHLVACTAHQAARLTDGLTSHCLSSLHFLRLACFWLEC